LRKPSPRDLGALAALRQALQQRLGAFTLPLPAGGHRPQRGNVEAASGEKTKQSLRTRDAPGARGNTPLPFKGAPRAPRVRGGGKGIVVLGGGFAGLWSAVGAARKLDELGRDPDAVAVTLVNRDAFHSIRVRNYESDLTAVRVPLDDVLGPIGVRRVEGQVTDLDLTAQAATVDTVDGPQAL